MLLASLLGAGANANDVVLATHHGLSVRFHESDVREMGRDTTGVKGIELGADDEVIGMVVIKREATLLSGVSPVIVTRTQIVGGSGNWRAESPISPINSSAAARTTTMYQLPRYRPRTTRSSAAFDLRREAGSPLLGEPAFEFVVAG